MGTCNLTCVQLGGVLRVAQYGQWDGYPEGQGQTALRFIRDRIQGFTLNAFTAKVLACRFGTEDEIKAAYAAFSSPEGWMTMDQAAAFKASPFGHMDRDVGAGILDAIFKSENGLMLQDESSFAGDSLFCKWAYVVNLDARQIEAYGGFNKAPVAEDERFAYLNEPITGKDQYFPVRHLKTYAFDVLPDDELFVSEVMAEADRTQTGGLVG